MYKYRASLNYFTRIAKYEVIKETPKTITYKNKLGKIEVERKISNDVQWFNTHQEAKDILTSKLNDQINNLQRQIDFKKAALKRILSLQE